MILSVKREHYNRMKTFQEFLKEAKEKPHDEVMKKMSKNWNRNNPGSNFNVQYRPSEDNKKNHIYLGLIDVNQEKRRAGKGTRFVRGITKYADKHKLPVSVKPVPEKGYETKLKSFYSKHGFEDNTSKDIAPHPMIRNPKK